MLSPRAASVFFQRLTRQEVTCSFITLMITAAPGSVVVDALQTVIE